MGKGQGDLREPSRQPVILDERSKGLTFVVTCQSAFEKLLLTGVGFCFAKLVTYWEGTPGR